MALSTQLIWSARSGSAQTYTDDMTAGQQLCNELNAALAHASGDHGRALEFTEVEQLTIARAARAADRAEQLQALWDAELAGQARAATLVRLSAELRLCDKAATDLTARVKIGVGVTKSERHVRAARSRWDRRQWDGA